nr:hypothetical protein [Pandoravirus aubagnensis]
MHPAARGARLAVGRRQPKECVVRSIAFIAIIASGLAIALFFPLVTESIRRRPVAGVLLFVSFLFFCVCFFLSPPERTRGTCSPHSMPVVVCLARQCPQRSRSKTMLAVDTRACGNVGKNKNRDDNSRYACQRLQP